MDILLNAWADADWIVRGVIVMLILHPTASAITRWTKTPTDDYWYGKIYNYVIRPLALNKGLAMQEKPGGDKPTP